uniref:SBNO alpha/beta domain-containing protein n=1 Tax=Laticauda laticaudata TaxID=8630 RepID=A0A8C5RW06_LATLA
LTPPSTLVGDSAIYSLCKPLWIVWSFRFRLAVCYLINAGFLRISFAVRGNKYICLLAEQTRGKYFTLYKPNIGKQSQLETMDSLFKKYQPVRPVSPVDAQAHWESSYDFSLKHCNHAVWNRNCKVVQEGKECFQGTRLRHYYMLCGALLRVWTKIASIMANITNTSYLQIVRLKTKEKKKQVGEWPTQTNVSGYSRNLCLSNIIVLSGLQQIHPHSNRKSLANLSEKKK